MEPLQERSGSNSGSGVLNALTMLIFRYTMICWYTMQLFQNFSVSETCPNNEQFVLWLMRIAFSVLKRRIGINQDKHRTFDRAALRS